MADSISIKDFKQLISDNVDDELADIGEDKSNSVKTGYFFTKWIHDLIIDSDGGYEEYAEIPEVKDKGVDFVLVDRSNKRVLIGQCKSNGLRSTGSKNAKKEDILGFWDIHSQLMSKEINYLEGASMLAINQLEEYKEWVENGYLITWRYITLEKRPENFKGSISNLSPNPKIEFRREVWGISELKDYFRDSVSLSDNPPEKINLALKSNSYYTKKGPKSRLNVGKTLVGTIGGNELANLYKKEKNSLFAYNIRQFLGKPNNKKIIETASDMGDQFFYFNNGITSICSSFERKENIITAYDFQIINGAQTVGSITAAANAGANIKDVEIMIRIVETGDLKTTQSGFNRDIVTYNNTQNKVETWDFISNDDIQQYLGKNLRNDNKQNGYRFTYQRKRIGNQKQGFRKVTPEIMAKILYAINFENFNPYIPTNEGKGKLVQSTEQDGLYDEIFKTSLNKWPNEYLAGANVGIQFYFLLDNFFRKLDKEDELKKVQGLKFHHIALLKYIIDKKDISLTKLHKNPKELREFYDLYAEKVIEISHMLLMKYSKDREGTNVFRKFARDEAEYTFMKKQCSLFIN
jgi:hypothetical protein